MKPIMLSDEEIFKHNLEEFSNDFNKSVEWFNSLEAEEQQMILCLIKGADLFGLEEEEC